MNKIMIPEETIENAQACLQAPARGDDANRPETNPLDPCNIVLKNSKTLFGTVDDINPALPE